MVEIDVDMGYLLEDGEPDCVTLNDENGEFEPMTFYRGDKDAVDFCKRVERAAKDRAPLELFGVSYEAVDNEPFCETVYRWLHGDAPQECRECPDGKYGELTAMVGGHAAIDQDWARDLIERHSDHISGNTREFYNGAYAEIADELNATFGHGWCEFKPLPGVDKGIPQGDGGNLDQSQVDWLRLMPDGWDGTPPTLGRCECEIETTENWLPAERYHRCKFCGAFFAVLDASGDIPPCVCPNCGKRVVKVVDE